MGFLEGVVWAALFLHYVIDQIDRRNHPLNTGVVIEYLRVVLTNVVVLHFNTADVSVKLVLAC